MTEVADEIRPLMGVRALATVAVVAFHLHPVLFLLAPSTAGTLPHLASGMLAVDFFFMLSGFIICHRYLEDLSRPTRERLGRYLVLRFARIWPVHAVLVLAFVAYDAWSRHALGYGLGADNTGTGNVLANLAMVYEFPDGSAINPPAWSLAPEFGAYLVFPLLALALVRIRRMEVAFGLAAVWVLAGTWLLWTLYLDIGPTQVSYTVAWLRIVICFPAGCLLAVGWRRLRWWQRTNTSWDTAALFGMGATLFVAWAVNRAGEFHAPVTAYPFLALTVLACAGASGVVAQTLGHPFMEWCGRLSYSVYVTHFLVIIAVYGKLVRMEAGAMSPLARLGLLAVVVALLAGAAAAAYYWVEEPARRFLRSVAHRRWGRVPESGAAPPAR